MVCRHWANVSASLPESFFVAGQKKKEGKEGKKENQRSPVADPFLASFLSGLLFLGIVAVGSPP
jgi:hypothetical protein